MEGPAGPDPRPSDLPPGRHPAEAARAAATIVARSAAEIVPPRGVHRPPARRLDHLPLLRLLHARRALRRLPPVMILAWVSRMNRMISAPRKKHRLLQPAAAPGRPNRRRPHATSCGRKGPAHAGKTPRREATAARQQGAKEMELASAVGAVGDVAGEGAIVNRPEVRKLRPPPFPEPTGAIPPDQNPILPTSPKPRQRLRMRDRSQRASGDRESSGERSGRPPRGRHREPHREPRREGPPRHSSPERAEHSEDHFEDEDEPQEISSGGGAVAPDLDDEGDDESGEPLVSYENIPTWEEAISYLLHPSQVQVEPKAPGNGSRPAARFLAPDQPRQTRHLGNRKHRR